MGRPRRPGAIPLLLLVPLLSALPASPALADGPGEEAPAAAPAAEEAPPRFLDRETLTGDWFGVRPRLLEHGLAFRGTWLEDFTRVQKGGADPHEDSRRYWLDLEASFDLGRIGAEGFRAVAAYWQTGGEYGSADAGAFDEISGYESPVHRRQLAEGFVEWTGAAPDLRLKAGKFDASEEFAWSATGDDFLNLGVAWSPNLLGMPAYPDPAFGAGLFWEPERGPYASGALMDGALQEGIRTGERGAATLFGDPSDLYGIVEVGAVLDLRGGPARGFLGGWSHTGEFPAASGGARDGTAGWYAGVEGRVPGTGREDPGDARGLHLHFRVNAADGDVSPIERHWVASAVWKGPLPSRPRDAAGLAWVYADLSDAPGTGFRKGFEQVVEGFYRVQVTGFLALTPSVQYVANPGGVHPDALVLGARLVIEF